MLYRDFSKALLLHPGVVRIEKLTDDMLDEVYGIEHSNDNVGFLPIDPVGLNDIRKKPYKLILFCSSEFPMFTDHFMDFVDSSGRKVGYDVLPSEKHLYQGSEYIWMTENLCLDTRLMSDFYIKCIIRSLSLEVAGVPDSLSPIVYYPCAAAADRINSIFGASGNITATVLVGVDAVDS